MAHVRTLAVLVVAALALAACSTASDQQSATPVTNATDDLGRIRISGDPAWMNRVAVSSNNPELQKMAVEMIRKNFSVRIVSVPKSFVLIRVFSCSDKTRLKLCLSVHYDGRPRSIAERSVAHGGSFGCEDSDCYPLEAMWLRKDYAAQDQVIGFVDHVFTYNLPH